MFSFYSQHKWFKAFFESFIIIVISAIWIGCGNRQESSDSKASDEATLGFFVSSLFGIDFIDNQKGWAVGKLGGVVHTDDGGQNWWTQASGIDFHLYDIEFIDANKGWAVGNLGSIIHTSDGGLNWTSQESGTQNILRGVVFPDKNRGWVVGDFATMLKTDNGGASWVIQKKVETILSTKKRLFLPTLLDITFVDEKSGWAVGFPGIILHTNDGGKNWKLQESPASGVLNSTTFIDALRGWITGNGGLILHTEDGGQNWVVQDSGVDYDLLKVQFSDPQKGWVVCYGDILSTSNGGQSWIAQKHEVDHWFYNIIFADKLNGWAVGDFGTIYHTSDAGKVWRTQTAKVSSGQDL